MNAERMPVECSICHRQFERNFREHLLEHSKEDLVRALLRLQESIDGDGQE